MNNPQEKLKKILAEYKESPHSKALSFEKWLIDFKYSGTNTANGWLRLTEDCGFITTAECRKTTQQLLNPQEKEDSVEKTYTRRELDNILDKAQQASYMLNDGVYFINRNFIEEYLNTPPKEAMELL